MGRVQTVRTEGFAAGMYDSASAAANFPKQAAALMRNRRPDYDGGAVTRGGSRFKNAAALPCVAGTPYVQHWPFRTAMGQEQIIAFVHDNPVNTGSLYVSTDGGATFALIQSGLQVAWWDHATMRVGATNYLILVNGGHAKKWDGSALSDVANCPSSPVCVAVANARCWMVGSNSNVIYGSAIADLETWSPGEGGVSRVIGGAEPITALIEAPGGMLLVLKRNEVALSDGIAETEIQVLSGARGVSQSVGTLHFRTVVSAGDQGVGWLSERGIEFFDGASVRQIGEGIRKFVGSMDRAACAAGEAHGYYHPERNELWLHLPTPGLSYAAAVVNLGTGAAWQAVFTAQHQVRSMYTGQSEYDGAERLYPLALVVNDASCLLAVMDREDLLVDGMLADGTGGVEIAAELHGAYYDFQHPARRKKADCARAVIQGPDGGVTLTLTLITDGGIGNPHALAVSASTAPKPYRARVLGRGVNFQVRVTGAGGEITAMELDGQLWDRSGA